MSWNHGMERVPPKLSDSYGIICCSAQWLLLFGASSWVRSFQYEICPPFLNPNKATHGQPKQRGIWFRVCTLAPWWTPNLLVLLGINTRVAHGLWTRWTPSYPEVEPWVEKWNHSHFNSCSNRTHGAMLRPVLHWMGCCFFSPPPAGLVITLPPSVPSVCLPNTQEINVTLRLELPDPWHVISG